MRHILALIVLLIVGSLPSLVLTAGQPTVPTTMPAAAETIVVRWHPAAQGDVLSIPKLRFNKWSPKHPQGWHFKSLHHQWLVDDKPATPREVVRRLRQIGGGGIVQIVEPFFAPVELAGQPDDNFGPEWVGAVLDTFTLARKDLRGTLGLTVAELNQITWLIDHERWGYVDYAGKATVRPWASHAIDWTVWCLRRADIHGPVINHATGVDKTIGLAAQTTNKNLSYPVLAGYVHDEFVYTNVQVLAAMDQAAAEWTGGWAYTHHAKNDPSLIDAARKRGCRWVLLWN